MSTSKAGRSPKPCWLTGDDVRAYRAGTESSKTLARKYGVAPSTILRRLRDLGEDTRSRIGGSRRGWCRRGNGERNRRILELVGKGKPPREVARLLGVTGQVVYGVIHRKRGGIRP